MPTFTYTMDDASFDLVKKAFTKNYNYQAEVVVGDGKVIPNPTSEAEFTLGQIQLFIKANVEQFQKTLADEVAAQHLAELKAQAASAGNLEIKVEG